MRDDEAHKGIWGRNAKVGTLLVAILIATPSPASAGPDKSTEFLMNTPASMLDVGLLRMDLYLTVIANALGPTAAIFTLRADYEWESNSIIIDAESLHYSGDEVDAEVACKNLIFYIRSRTGKTMSSIFGHRGYTNEATKEALTDIDSKIGFSCIISFADDAVPPNELRSLNVRGPLTEDTFLISREPR